MPVMNFDLEDGLPPVSFTLRESDAERFMTFIDECQAIKEAAGGKDAERLDYLVEEGCQIENLTLQSGTRYRLHWPDSGEAQSDWFDTPRAAIDRAMAGKEQS